MKPLFDMLGSPMGQAALGQMAQRAGLSPAQAQMAMRVLVPAIAGGMKKRAQADPSGLDAALGQAHARRTADAPDAVATDDGVRHGNEVLGTVFGSKDVSRTVASHASAQTGIDAGKLKALLPMAAALAAGAAAKHGASPAGGSTAATAPARGGLMGMLDADGDGNPLDDILGMAGKAGFR